jgi:hypothetical protein
MARAGARSPVVGRGDRVNMKVTALEEPIKVYWQPG